MMAYHDDGLVWTATGEAPIGCGSCGVTFAGVTIVIAHASDPAEVHVCLTCTTGLLAWKHPRRRRPRASASASAAG